MTDIFRLHRFPIWGIISMVDLHRILIYYECSLNRFTWESCKIRVQFRQVFTQILFIQGSVCTELNKIPIYSGLSLRQVSTQILFIQGVTVLSYCLTHCHNVYNSFIITKEWVWTKYWWNVHCSETLVTLIMNYTFWQMSKTL